MLILETDSTTYNQVSRVVQHHADRINNLNVSSILITQPSPHSTTVSIFREHLKSLNRHKGQNVVAIIDGASSNPGTVFPWEDMVKVCEEEGVFSLVDAAHGIGMAPVNLGETRPDAWVSVSFIYTSVFTRQTSQVNFLA